MVSVLSALSGSEPRLSCELQTIDDAPCGPSALSCFIPQTPVINKPRGRDGNRVTINHFDKAVPFEKHPEERCVIKTRP